MILTWYFACTRKVIQKSLNQNSSKWWDFVQVFGPQLSIFYYFGVDSQHLKQKLEEKKNSGKIVTSLAYIFTMVKALVKIIFGRKIFICNRFSTFLWHFLEPLNCKRKTRSYFADGVSEHKMIYKKAVSKGWCKESSVCNINNRITNIDVNF